MASDESFPGSAFDRVARLLKEALDLTESSELRAQAWRELMGLDDSVFRAAFTDGRWDFVQDALAGFGVKDEPQGGEPWMPTDRGGGSPGPAPHLVELYTQDIRALLSHDFATPPIALDEQPGVGTSLLERAEHLAAASAQAHLNWEGYARGCGFTLLNPGVAIAIVAESTGRDRRALGALWSHIVGPEIAWGLPPALARLIVRLPAGPVGWLEEIDRWLMEWLHTGLLLVGGRSSVAAGMLQARLHIARSARAAEITDGRALAAADLLTTAHLLRAAGRYDVASAWCDSHGDVIEATRSYLDRDRSGELRFDVGMRGVLTRPSSEELSELPRSDVAALAYTHAVRQSAQRDADGRYLPWAVAS